MSFGETQANDNVQGGRLESIRWLPPFWVLLYMGSIFAANWAGSGTDTIVGVNIEHVLLGAALGLAVVFLLFEANFRQIDGLNRLWKYLGLFGLAVFLGFLSSIHPGPKVVGAGTLIYWCGLIVSIGIAALAAMRGYTRWVLVAIALAGVPLMMSVFQPFFPFLARLLPVERLQAWYMGRATGVFEDPNSTGFALYCSYGGCLCLLSLARRRALKYMCALLCPLYIVAAGLTLSRACISLTVLTTLVFLYTLWRRLKYRHIVISAMFVLALIGLHQFFWGSYWREAQRVRVFDEKLYERDTFRIYGLRGVMRQGGGLLLLGEGTNEFVKRSHIYLKGFTGGGKSIYGTGAHAQILQVWVEWGLLALLLLYSAHAWVILGTLNQGDWRHNDTRVLLLTAYICVLLNLQLNCVNTPAGCALLGLLAGSMFQKRPDATHSAVLSPALHVNTIPCS